MTDQPDGLLLPPGATVRAADGPAPVPRDAATVMLVRDGDRGLEVFLLQRVVAMEFASGMSVFPGGGVDVRDRDASIGWAGPPPQDWARWFGCVDVDGGADVELARALVCAAVRETFEECGVLLAGPDADSVIADAGRYSAARAALVSREVSFAEFLAAEQLVLRADLLRPWAHWITPESEPRRYDTRFLVAVLPPGQRADGDTTEAQRVAWHTPADALDDWRAHRVGLLPPTWVTLSELAEYSDTSGVLAARRTIAPIVPRVVRDGDRLRVVLPDDPRYAEAAAHLAP